MPRYESADENHIVVKLKSGYNIGIELTKIQSITKVEQWSYQNVSINDVLLQARKGEVEYNGSKKESPPRIALISTGGTIASRIDYRTGGVHAALSASDLYASVPELSKYASVDPEVIFWWIEILFS